MLEWSRNPAETADPMRRSKRQVRSGLGQSRVFVGPVFVGMLLLTLPAFSGCSGCHAPSGSGGSGGAPKADTAEAPPTPLLEGWEKPAVALVLSGEQRGYLEPCGCSERQTGGIGRRDDLIHQIEERGWAVTSLDLGSTVRRSRDQSRIKHEVLLTALHDMQCEVIGAGPEELQLGADFLLSRYSPNPDQPSLVSANVVLYEAPEIGTPVRYRMVEAEGVKIGVTSVLGKSVQEKVFPEGSNTDVSFLPPEESLRPVLEQMQAEQPQLLVLLSHSSLDESHKLAQTFPEFDLIVSAGGYEDPTGRPERVGETMIVTVGQKGKYAGVLGYYPDNAEQPLRFELVSLDQRFSNTERMHQHMQYYQDQLRDFQGQGVVHTEPPIPHPRGAVFAGAQTCAECHKKAYAVWKETRHAHAYESLEKGRPGEEATWISRIHDPECLSCHTTGWNPQDVLRYEGGFVDGKTHVDAEGRPLLAGQQCENCHGPGSRHVELEQSWIADRDATDRAAMEQERRAMHLTIDIAEKSLCRTCHDVDNSPKFNFETYWKKVVHRGKD